MLPVFQEAVCVYISAIYHDSTATQTPFEARWRTAMATDFAKLDYALFSPTGQAIPGNFE